MNKVKRFVTTPDRVDWFVNVYIVDRAYGGPEEGGWYYDTGELIETKQFFGMGEYGNVHESAVAYSEQVKKELEQADELEYKTGYGPHDGCDDAGNGDDNYLIRGGTWGRGTYRIDVTTNKGKNYPEYTPHYE